MDLARAAFAVIFSPLAVRPRTVTRLGVRSVAGCDRPQVESRIRVRQTRRLFCQAGTLAENVRSKAAQSSRELAGRRAGVGYSAVAIGSTRAEGPPSFWLIAKISRANPHQVTS